MITLTVKAINVYAPVKPWEPTPGIVPIDPLPGYVAVELKA